MSSNEVGGKGREAPLVAEKANRVWRSGWIFSRIRAEKDGNRKRKCDKAHDGVGSSGAGVTGMTTDAKFPTVCSVGEFLCVSG